MGETPLEKPRRLAQGQSRNQRCSSTWKGAPHQTPTASPPGPCWSRRARSRDSRACPPCPEVGAGRGTRRKLCGSRTSPGRRHADRRSPRRTNPASPGAPPNAAPATPLPETSQKPPGDFRPLLGATNELGMSPRAAGHPSRPCVRPVTPAAPQPAAHARP